MEIRKTLILISNKDCDENNFPFKKERLNPMKKLIFLPLFFLFAINLFASEIVWEAINPSFGGNPYNGTYLLNSAQLQKDAAKKAEQGSTSANNAATQFQESLNRLLLSRLASKILDSLYGANGELVPGNYEIGDYIINISQQNNTIVITLDDILTGGHTVIEIPNL
jgi:curli production assembly/transport component CsgF